MLKLCGMEGKIWRGRYVEAAGIYFLSRVELLKDAEVEGGCEK